MTRGALELATGERVAGKYRIESVLGRGGMGAVYLAVNEDLGRRVAIKVLLGELAFDDQLLKRFRQEARTAAAIGHPGIVDVLDLGTTESGSPFIVMEALEGETLGERIARTGLPPVADALAIVDEALDALAAAHAKGILHRDLKPDNLFLVVRPVPLVKILDFGIAKLGEGAEDVSLTRTGMVFGTPLFMSPEQARGAKNAGPPSDVYAMGAIVYQLLTGRTPFTGTSYNEVLSKLLTEAFEPLARLRPDLPAPLVAVVERMLARDPAERPADAGAARDALRTVTAQLGPALAAAPPPRPPAVDAVAATVPPTVAPDAPTMASTPPGDGGAVAALTPVPVRSSGPIATTAPTEARGSAPPVATPARRGAPLVAIGLGCALLIGGGVYAVTRSGSAPARLDGGAGVSPVAVLPIDAAPPPLPPDAASPAPTMLPLPSLAPRATWQLDGQPVACPPCRVDGPPGSRHHLVVSAPGYVAQTFDIELGAPVAFPAALARAHAAQAPVDAGVAAPPPAVDAAPPHDAGRLTIDKQFPGGN